MSLSKVSPPTTITRRADERAGAGDDRRGAAVAERVGRAREEQERAVGEEPDPEGGERGREEVGIVAAVAHREHAHRRQRERDERGAHRQQQPGHAVEPPPEPIGERPHVAGAGVDGELGEDRGVDRLREDRVRRQERDEAELVGDHSTGDLVAHDHRGAEQDRDVGLQRDPRREPQQAAELAVDRAEGRAETEPRPQERDHRHADEADDPERAPDGEDELLGEGEVEVGVGPCMTRNAAIVATTITVLAIGATAVITNRRLANSTAVATVPTA